MSGDAVSFVAVIAAMFALILALAFAKARLDLGHETSRKAAHAAMGAVAAAFPWLFDSSAWVALVAATACVFILSLRLLPALDGVLRGVERASLGQLYFPIGIAFAFHFSNGEPAIYCPPALALAFGDSLAALIGTRIGRLRYTTGEGFKTWEGSVALLAAVFLTTCLALLALSSFSLPKAMLIALLFATVCALIEATAWRGLDNLLLPVCGLFAMSAYYDLGASRLWIHLVVLVAFICLAFACKRISTLNDSALFGTALTLYLVWATAGWTWTLSPLLAFVAFPLVLTFDYDRYRDFQTVAPLLFMNAVAFIWLAQAQRVGPLAPDLYWPFSASYAFHLCMIWGRRDKALLHPRTAVFALPLLAALLVQAAPSALGGALWQGAPLVITYLAGIGCSAFALSQERSGRLLNGSFSDWFFRCVLAGLGSILVFAFA